MKESDKKEDNKGKKEEKKEDKEKTKFSKINPIKLGLTLGIVLAICIFLTTLASLFDFFPIYNAVINDIYNFLSIENQWINLFLWSIYAFIDGFIFGWVFGKVYNWLLVYKKIPKIAANMNAQHKKPLPKEQENLKLHFKGPLKK